MSAEVLEYLLPFMHENQIIKTEEVVRLNGAVLKSMTCNGIDE